MQAGGFEPKTLDKAKRNYPENQLYTSSNLLAKNLIKVLANAQIYSLYPSNSKFYPEGTPLDKLADKTCHCKDSDTLLWVDVKVDTMAQRQSCSI